jgi:hypothetical protein
MKEVEIWKDVVGHEGLYQISSFGRVKSFYSKDYNGRILKLKNNGNGYMTVCLCKNKIHKTTLVHRLVAFAFLELIDHKKHVDHIDGNKANNKVSNLRWCSPRENSCFYFEKLGKELPIGVHIDEDNKKVASITINGIKEYIGRFETVEEASLAYNDILQNGVKNIDQYRKRKRVRKFGNIKHIKKTNKFVATYRMNKKSVHVGTFKTEDEADNALNNLHKKLKGD